LQIATPCRKIIELKEVIFRIISFLIIPLLRSYVYTLIMLVKKKDRTEMRTGEKNVTF
jgi:hypothetical protein